jgi:hypothetical protein
MNPGMDFGSIRDGNYNSGCIVRSTQEKAFLKQTQGALVLQPAYQ